MLLGTPFDRFAQKQNYTYMYMYNHDNVIVRERTGTKSTQYTRRARWSELVFENNIFHIKPTR